MPMGMFSRMGQAIEEFFAARARGRKLIDEIRRGPDCDPGAVDSLIKLGVSGGVRVNGRNALEWAIIWRNEHAGEQLALRTPRRGHYKMLQLAKTGDMPRTTNALLARGMKLHMGRAADFVSEVNFAPSPAAFQAMILDRTQKYPAQWSRTLDENTSFREAARALLGFEEAAAPRRRVDCAQQARPHAPRERRVARTMPARTAN